MPAISASAPGKIILFGEHAVVYGYPAIAVPVSQVQARAIVKANPLGPPGKVHLEAPNVSLSADLEDLPPEDPLGKAVRLVLEELDIERPPALNLRVTSTIPLAAGLGSGAAVSVALIRALAEFLGRPLEDERVSALAYEVEVIHHGTPSGIDNTVITYARPVYYRRDQPIETFPIRQPFRLVIADSGLPSPTAETVAHVRRSRAADPQRYALIFESVGEIVQAARKAIEGGETEALGPLMDQNHELLGEMGVSSPSLDRLVAAARQAGALGAKLSGGGRGGNIIALVDDDRSQAVAETLEQAGAARTFTSLVGNQTTP